MFVKLLRIVIIAALSCAPAAADPPRVVVSVTPIHALVAAVMAGVGTPELIVGPGFSPHTRDLRPSAARALSEAEVIFWVGENLETFLAKPLKSLSTDAKVITLSGAEGLLRLPPRGGGAWEDAAGHSAEDGEHEGGEESDPHFWLDPVNAKRTVDLVVSVLAELDPGNADRYERNGSLVAARLAALDSEISGLLAPVRHEPYVVFHDAYQYFEHRYRTGAVGSITVSPERRPGVRRVMEIRRKIRSLRARCVFYEPQFEPGLVRTVIEGTPVRLAVLDPLGNDLTPGPEAYFRLMRELARALQECLSAR